MPADLSAIDAAIIARLVGDSALSALMPDGVWRDVAPDGKSNFVIVSSQTDESDVVFNDELAWAELAYLVKAVSKHTSGAEKAVAAAARIDALLNTGAGATRLTIAGFSCQRVVRSPLNGRVAYSELDSKNETIRWQHRGGLYDVFVTPN